MPKDLLYASFKDAPYTSQFVGSTFNELKDAQVGADPDIADNT